MVIIFLLSESLLLFIVTLFVSGFLFSSMKFCLYPWAWLGLDSHLPVLFDLRSTGLEVATWDYCFLRRRLWPADRLKDVRVYKEAVDCSEALPKDSNHAVPIFSSDKVSKELPSFYDASTACFGTCWRSCCNSSSSTLVAGVFLGAKVEGEVVRLTRNVWSLREVERLLQRAQKGRELLGLPEVLPGDLEAPEVVQVDLDCEAAAMTFGKEGLPTICEDAMLREPSAQSMEAFTMASAKDEVKCADDRQTHLSTVVRPGVAPRPKMKSQSQAKVQDLLTV